MHDHAPRLGPDHQRILLAQRNEAVQGLGPAAERAPGKRLKIGPPQPQGQESEAMATDNIGQRMPGLGPTSRGGIAQSKQIVEGHGPKPLLSGTQLHDDWFEPIKDRGRFIALVEADPRTFAIEEQIELHLACPALS